MVIVVEGEHVQMEFVHVMQDGFLLRQDVIHYLQLHVVMQRILVEMELVLGILLVVVIQDIVDQIVQLYVVKE